MRKTLRYITERLLSFIEMYLFEEHVMILQ